MTKNLPEKTNENSDFLSVIERLSTQDVDVEKIEKIIEMQERIMDRNAKQSFYAAMARVQSKIPEIKEDKKNTQTNSTYASFKSLMKTIKPLASEEGFSQSYYEGETSVEENIRVCATVRHELGHAESYWVDIPLDMKGIMGKVNKTKTHGKISSVTYGKSALAKLIWNVPTGEGDDDGNAAGSAYITEDQQIKINDMINAIPNGEKRFKAWLEKKNWGANSVETIPSNKYKETIVALNDVKHRKPLSGQCGGVRNDSR
jgi:hypothetical protein